MIHKYRIERAAKWGHQTDRVIEVCSGKHIGFHELNIRPQYKEYSYRWAEVDCPACLKHKGVKNDLPGKNKQTRRHRRVVPR